MKKVFLIVFATILLAISPLLLTACGKTDETPAPKSNTPIILTDDNVNSYLSIVITYSGYTTRQEIRTKGFYIGSNYVQPTYNYIATYTETVTISRKSNHNFKDVVVSYGSGHKNITINYDGSGLSTKQIEKTGLTDAYPACPSTKTNAKISTASGTVI